MTNTFDEQQVLAWLQTLYGDCKGFINIVSTNNWAGRSFDTPEAATAYVKQLDRVKPQGIYARITTLKAPVDKGRGTIEDTAEFVGFWADLDIAGPGHKWELCPDPCPKAAEKGHGCKKLPLIADEAACIELVERTGFPAPTEWIHSGGGMYPLWLLAEPVKVADYPELPQVSAQWQRVIELTAKNMGFMYGAGVGDLARVLRIPGTVNRKPDTVPVSAEWRMDLSSSTPYDLSILVEAMSTSLKRLEPPKPVTAPAPARPASAPSSGERVGDAFNRATTWMELLEADGATLDNQRGGYAEWVRPGKDPRGGISATTGFGGSDVLKIHTDSWHPLEQGKTYDRYGYYTWTRHGGDFGAATRDLGGKGYGDSAWTRGPAAAEAWHHAAVEPAPGEAADAAAATGDHETRPQVAAAPPARPRKATFTYTESGFADRLEARTGGTWKHYGADKGSTWLRWDGALWREDEKGAVINLVDELVTEEFDRIEQIEDPKEQEAAERSIRAMQTNAKQVGASKIFARRKGTAVTPEELNAHQYKMTVGNGVFDLATMTFGPHDRTLLATKKLGVDYDAAAKAPEWERFLEQVIPNPEMRDYLQRAVGYTLTGDTDRKALFMVHGVSNCGKSQLVNALAAVFGDFAAAADYSAFEQRENNGNANPGLHKLQGARFVHCSETAEGTRLNETLIKRITGGDEIVSRTLYGRDETWKPQLTLFIATNHLPRLSSDDDAIWRRVKPIELPVVFGTAAAPEVLDIGRKLAAKEGAGILNWMLEGLRRYREEGLGEPQELRDGVQAYQDESDPVARFIAEAVTEQTLVKEADAVIPSSVLYAWFQAWCQEEGIRFPLSANRFGRRLTRLGFTGGRDPSGSKRVWKGIGAGPQVWVGSGQPLRT